MLPAKVPSLSTHNTTVPPSHPRAASLRIREQLVEAWHAGIVADAGLIAHGRGEAFDYILGEQTLPPARKAINAASALLLNSENPVVSVNGNVAALCAEQLVKIAEQFHARLEVNLFYRSGERAAKIAELLHQHGAVEVLGVSQSALSVMPQIESERRKIDSKGIAIADTVLVPLEDGDRTLALRKLEKNVIAVDLNPLSRTSKTASITIVDNVLRALPEMLGASRKLSELSTTELEGIVSGFDNQANLAQTVSFIGRRLNDLCKKGLSLEVS